MIPFSVLDLAPIPQGSDPARALRQSLDLAQHAERWGYHRYWLAEHHNMPGIASAATAVVIGYIAGGTQRIRVGAGGIMLPNHAPLIIAEQFGTLASLYPGRIDLGVGRAPGTDATTLRALRRDIGSAERFPQDVLELMHYFEDPRPGQALRAIPGAGLKVPVWILGSSLFGAHLAAQLGLPYAFASHFAPDQLLEALAVYRARFQPSAVLNKPYVMLGVNICAAETDAEARRLFTSLQQMFVALRYGNPGPLPPPLDAPDAAWSSQEQALLDRVLGPGSIVGGPDTVRQGLADFIARTQADELMLTGTIYDHDARLRSFEIAAELRASVLPLRSSI